MKQKLISFLAAQTDLSADKFTDDATPGDLGLDSLDWLELLLAVEQEFALKLDPTTESIAGIWSQVEKHVSA